MPLTFEYDTIYSGPALPIVEVSFHSLENEDRSVAVRALVDSSADATMISLTTLQTLGARQVDRMRMSGVGGGSRIVDIYEVGVRIGSFTPDASHS